MDELRQKPPRIAVFGANGQVGWQLKRSLQPLGEIFSLDRTACSLDDVSQLRATLARLDGLEVQVLVNAAAYTAVDKAETEVDLAHLINEQAPKLMGEWAKKRGALLIHYSTDYVFDGSGDHFRDESAPTDPLSVYGQSKLRGEQAIADTGCSFMCFRTSWVYAARGNNFAKTMLRLSQERDELRVVGDQWGAPTGADLIADVTAHALKSWLATDALRSARMPAKAEMLGVFHLAAAGVTNWHSYARLVVERAKLNGLKLRMRPDALTSIDTCEYPTPAVRPKNSRLDCRRLEAAFGLRMPVWQAGVERLVDELSS